MYICMYVSKHVSKYVCIKLSHVLYCNFSYSLYFKHYLLHNLFSCNCKEVQVDIHNERSFQMFRIFSSLTYHNRFKQVQFANYTIC